MREFGWKTGGLQRRSLSVRIPRRGHLSRLCLDIEDSPKMAFRSLANPLSTGQSAPLNQSDFHPLSHAPSTPTQAKPANQTNETPTQPQQNHRRKAARSSIPARRHALRVQACSSQRTLASIRIFCSRFNRPKGARSTHAFSKSILEHPGDRRRGSHSFL